MCVYRCPRQLHFLSFSGSVATPLPAAAGFVVMPGVVVYGVVVMVTPLAVVVMVVIAGSDLQGSHQSLQPYMEPPFWMNYAFN
jgi:hypothetical protein